MSYENYELGCELENSEFTEVDESGEECGDVIESYEDVIERYENPGAQLFGREGSELPDGVAATEYQSEDDGTQSRLIDVDGDGIFETTEVIHSEEGQVDRVFYISDIDADGSPDRQEAFIINTYGENREVEMRIISADFDGDGEPEVVQFQEKSGDAQSFSADDFTEKSSFVFDEAEGGFRRVIEDPANADEAERQELDMAMVDAALHPISIELDDGDYEKVDKVLEDAVNQTEKAVEDSVNDIEGGKDVDDTKSGAGENEVFEKYFDSNGDGIEDYGVFRSSADVDSDGVKENYYWENIDIDGNGTVDATMVAADLDGDGKYDKIQVFQYDQNGDAELVKEMDIDDPDRGDYYFELRTYDPENSNPSEVKGDPESAMEHWEYQGSTQRCAVYAQMFVIEEMTGAELNIEDVAAYAVERGWFDEQQGTYPDNMKKLLDAYGIENELKYNCEFSELESALEDGKRIIVAVDSDEYAAGENDDIYVPDGDRPNHAVEVIGVDRSDPEHPMVILNDSGHVNGQGAMVPLDEFVDAWDDSNNLAVICG